VQLERFPGLRQLPALLRRPQDDVVLFQSWGGTFSDNPRAIAERLHERRPGLRQIWAAEEAAESSLPEWALPVRPGSREYLAALGVARHVVANTHLPDYFRKRDGTVYLQTWHGTPLKRIGLDIPDPGRGLGPKYIARLHNDVAKWDVLLSPNAFSTPIFRAAFGFEGRIIESGYPRNDLLASPESPPTRRAVRSALGIADGTLVVLYAPTLRDGAQFEMALDLARMRRRLGDRHLVLVRLHPTVAARIADGDDVRALDVSAHSDIRELYLAADVLVTDYSSAMFDFAVTGKPMLFYTYDLAEYRDDVRGFYFDFERTAPGPLLSTTDEVCDALADLDRVAEAHAPAYARFAERFCALEDGDAAGRVVDAMFGA
jgi:CDP-glycerol glycerophosphotransferase